MNWEIVSHDRSIIADRLGKILDIPVRMWPSRDPVGMIFFRMMNTHRMICDKLPAIPKICYWTGTDARTFEGHMVTDNCLHVTDSPLLIPMLSVKVDTPCFVPIPVSLKNVDVPLDENPCICMYVIDHPAYDVDRSAAVIREIKDIPIYMMAGKGDRILDHSFQDNIIDVPWIKDDEREDVFRKVSTYIRLMKYDGLSQSVVEMKAMGRHVLYTERNPYCTLVVPEDSPNNIADMVRVSLSATLDFAGAEWYRNNFSRSNFITILGELCRRKGWDFPYGTS